MNTSKKTLAKGCAGLTIFFLFLFVLGIWTIFSTTSDQIEQSASIQSYIIDDQLNQLDASIETVYMPIVTITHNGESYLDTLSIALFEEQLPQDSIITVYFFPESPDQATTEGPGDYYIIYFVYLFLAMLAYLGYRRFSKAKPESAEKPNLGESIAEKIPIKLKPTEIIPEQTSQSSSKQASPWIVILVGVGVIAVGLGFGYYTYSKDRLADYLKSNGARVESLVNEMTRSGKTGNQTYNFELDYQWKEKSYTYHTSFKSEFYKPGDRVLLLIDPLNPENAMIESVWDMDKGSYFWTLILMTIGSLIVVMGIRQMRSKNDHSETKY
jgi:hypothetical protein